MAQVLTGRSALVTGASQGLGRAIAAAFVDQGASVALCARDAAALERARTELAARTRPPQRVVAWPCDVARPEQVRELVARAVAALPDLEILVNCAGMYGPKGRAEDVDWSAWVEAIEVNLLGSVLTCREVVPHLRRRGRGKIIQLSGGGATAPMARVSAYAASKAGVVRFAETLAIELAEDHVDVNCLAPGAVNTRMLDEALAAGAAALGEAFHRKLLAQKASGGEGPDKAAALAVFLASPQSDGITGKLISAVWDPWERLPEHRRELAGSDVYTLRRIVPRDRGQGWGER